MHRARALLVLVLVFGSLVPFEAHCQVTIDFVSDATWESFAMNPDGSQGASMGAPQFPGWAVHGASLSLIPGAMWMWFPGVTVSSLSDLQGAYFSRVFYLSGLPLSGTIYVAVDDFAEVRVNGALAGSTGSVTDHALAASAQESLKAIDLSPYLVGGLNSITVKAQNGPHWFSGYGCNPCDYGTFSNPAGVVFGGSLRFDPVTPSMRGTWGGVKVRYR